MINKILEEKGEDLLYSAARIYSELITLGYHIVLGRKGKEYHIQLRFRYDSFFHLTGLQHLKDLTYPSQNKERIYKEIRNRNLTYKDISKSQYFEEFHIKERIEYLKNLETILDSCKLTFLINPREYAKYTKIRADYLFEYKFLMKELIILYLFIVKESHSQISNECKGCSFFRNHDVDFTRGASKATVLFIEKYQNVDTRNQIDKVLYRNPVYKDKRQKIHTENRRVSNLVQFS